MAILMTGNVYIKYLKTVLLHKWYVFLECRRLGITWQGVMHDMSKLSPKEFFASARYYGGDGNAEIPYMIAWMHHKGHNPHHWEYWVDWNTETGECILMQIPKRYLKETLADLIGASKAYNKGKFDRREPYDYFMAHAGNWRICREDYLWLERRLKEYAGIEL